MGVFQDRLIIGFALGGGPCLAEGDITGISSPSSAHLVPVRLGTVDAVRGNLSLSLPLGPTIPGRLPSGLTWHFDSQDAVQFRIGGTYQAARWPVGSMPTPATTVLVGGTRYSFQQHFAATAEVPTDSECQSLMATRGVDTGEAEAGNYSQPVFVVLAKQPSSDGTKWYLKTKWNVGSYDRYGNPITISVAPRKVILDGSNAIWTADDHTTHFTNRWGDHVVATETTGDSLHPATIMVANQAVPSEWIKLEVTLAVAPTMIGQSTFQANQSPGALTDSGNLATLLVSNGMGLPSVSLKGMHRTNTTVDGTFSGFIPGSWVASADGESVQTQFAWGTEGTEEVPTTDQDPQGPGFTKMVASPIVQLASATHTNGLIEQFIYDAPSNLSAKAFTTDGFWSGYHIGISGTSSAYGEVPNPTSMVGVQSIRTMDGASGRTVLILHQEPTINKAAGTASYTWSSPAHMTWVLNYASSSPASTPAYRGIRLTHPSAGTFTDILGSSAYLFATSAVLSVERIRGVDAPSDLNLIPRTWFPSSPQVDQISIMDGWDLRSWANPTGSLGLAIPVTAVATRISTYTTNLPTKITVAGSTRDTWGPIQSDEYTLPPGSSLPTVSGLDPGAWSSGLGSQTGNIKRSGLISRHWDRVALELVTDTDHKSLGGTDLNALRGVASTDFGVTTYGHESGSGFLLSTTGTREATAQEIRSYVTGTPLLQSVTKYLSSNGALPYSGSIGTTYTYDSSAHQWLATEGDKLTGRTTSYQRDALGRPTLTTDPNGVQVRTDYDGWGRPRTQARLAKGGVGSVVTSYTYDPMGLWKIETLTADGRNLTTRTEFDLWGRVTRVVQPDGSTQQTGYDGWGQKVAQTPMLKPGQSAYGNFTWTYSDKGFLTASFDPKGRRLTSAYDPAVGPTGLWEPQWVGADNRVVTRTWDDREFLRQEKLDLLGQKREVVDQAGQISLYTYDQDGHLKHTDQGGQGRDYTYDLGTGWLTSRKEPEEGITYYDNFTALGTPQHSRMIGRSENSNVETATYLDGWHRPYQVDVTNAGSLVTRRALTYRNDFNSLTSLTETQTNGTLSESYGYDDLARQ